MPRLNPLVRYAVPSLRGLESRLAGEAQWPRLLQRPAVISPYFAKRNDGHMSFDLHFCWRKVERINFEEVKSWALQQKCFSCKHAQLWYANPQTGVYFSFNFEAPESPEDAPRITGGYFDSGLSFNLNYNRPSYFGLEALPVVETLAARFALSVFDPQAVGDEPKLLTDVRSESLVQSWLKHNRWATLALAANEKSSKLLRMAPSASLYLWKYRRAKDALQEKCGDGIFVPSLVPVRKKGSTSVGRAFTYTQGLPMIVPESEWIFIVTRKKGFFLPKKEQDVAVISAETFRARLVGCIKAYQWPDPSVEIVGPESAEKAGKFIQSIDHTIARSEFEIIGADGFVDVEMPDGK